MFGKPEKMIGKLFSFLTGQTFTSQICLGQFNEKQQRCIRGPKHFIQHALGTIHPVQQTLLLFVWQQRELSCGSGRKDEKEKKEKWVPVPVFHSLWRELICLLIGGRSSIVSETQNDCYHHIVVG